MARSRSPAKQGLLAPYQVSTWADIPDSAKDATGAWYYDYGGYISIGCDSAKITTCPKTFADLLKPEYKGKVALNGDPTKSGSAFAGVFGAALANGGSFDKIQPGIDYFANLKKSGNYIPVESTPATIEKGETPISIDWDYLNAGYVDSLKAKGINWQVAGSDPAASTPTTTCQAISKFAPHPAAARLWEEFLYSDEGREPVAQGQGPSDPDGQDDRRRHRDPGSGRRAAEGVEQDGVPDPGPDRRGEGCSRRRLVQGHDQLTRLNT